MFDTRIAYVAETGAANARVKRIAIMDSDGYDHTYVTAGGTSVLTPRLSPKGGRLAFVAFENGIPQIRVARPRLGRSAAALPGESMSFAPRYSRDGSRIVFSMMLGANSDIYVVGANGGIPPPNDCAGNRYRSELLAGRKQDRFRERPGGLSAAICDERRRIRRAPDQLRQRCYGTPEWSPDGKLIAFTWRFGELGGSESQDRRQRREGPDGGPRRRGTKLGGEQPGACLPAHRGQQATGDLSRQPGRQRAPQDDHSPGRLRSELVRIDGLGRCANSSCSHL